MKMKKSKQEKLENAGWKVGSVEEFFSNKPEAMMLEIKRLQCLLSMSTYTINELRNILPDPEKLNTLAHYFECEQSLGKWGGKDGNTDVQDDLRIWAKDIENILHTTEAIAKEN